MCVTGSRSIGKSTGIALLCLLNYIFNGKKFMYIRRRPKTVQKTAKTFFNNAVEIINSNDKVDITIVGFKYYNGRYYIATKLTEEGEPAWEECGKSQALSDEEDDKSAIYSEYNILIYDEFITKDKNRYLSTNANIEAEWDACVSLYQTVDRGVNKPFRNETVFFLLGNKSTVFNPIFITLGIINYLNADAKYTAPKGEIWLWNDIDGVEATSKYADSFAYKMSTDRTKKYAYENDGGDNNDFVEKPKNAKYIATFILKKQSYGVYVKDKVYYIDKAHDDIKGACLDLESHGSGQLFYRKWQESPLMCMLSKAFQEGRLRFGNVKIKAALLAYLQFL